MKLLIICQKTETHYFTFLYISITSNLSTTLPIAPLKYIIDTYIFLSLFYYCLDARENQALLTVLKCPLY